MDYVHFHCKNCHPGTPEMYNNQTIPNITCIEELRKIINSNLRTNIRYNLNCKNCVKIKNEFMDIDNYRINSNLKTGIRDDFYCKNCVEIKNRFMNIDGYIINYYYCDSLRIYNKKLIEEYGLFTIDYSVNYGRININNWTNISKKEFFDSIKVGSLLQIVGPTSDIIDKIKEKFDEVSLVQIVDIYNYYLIKNRPTLTKPARKNNSNN